MKRRVVVTGMGAITPVGNDVATTWRAITPGVSGGAAITKFDRQLSGSLRVRSEGLRSAHVSRAQGSQACGLVRAVRHRRVCAGDDRRRIRRTSRVRSGAHRRDHRQRHRRSQDVRGAARRLPRARPEQDQRVLHSDVHLRHRGRPGLDAIQRARDRTTRRSPPAPRARTRSATRIARSSTATRTSSSPADRKRRSRRWRSAASRT